MATKRQQKFSKLIKEEISKIFQHQFSGAFSGKLVTITDVEMSPDLGFAKIFVSVFPIIHSDQILDHIEENKSKVRGALGRTIGKQVRVIPELAFFLDSTAEYASRMDLLIDSLDIPETDPTDEED
ncbi:30S ribosome-binding factor RbfA [Roseivirga sp. UBA838]|uniref:30S ribosome-binding factor RbfA n=1 Tax=Roseivirga sp. UBA838 TaxID=1947393 RepID=UPI002579ABB9|nr:30S ribosome-binding factor RbfA [Roseivirga sp. UBA838]|tara:strand:+ start:78197 stop:78574 length:378 start_codon:yes stop_codon:yes gene_type:complete